VLLTLDSDLHELQRQEALLPLTAGLAYRMPDRSLVLLGSELHDIGERYTSQFMHVDPTLGRFAGCRTGIPQSKATPRA
jgi:hypothetical protein